MFVQTLLTIPQVKAYKTIDQGHEHRYIYLLHFTKFSMTKTFKLNTKQICYDGEQFL